MPVALDPSSVARVDSSSQFSEVLDLGTHLRDGLWRVDSAGMAPIDAPGGYVVSGMGGSGVGALLALGALRGRLRSLTVDQLVQLRAYEKSKADRLPVVTMLDNRIAKLSAGDATATGNAPEAPSAKASTAKKPPKKVGDTAYAKNDNSPPHSKVRYT